MKNKYIAFILFASGICIELGAQVVTLNRDPSASVGANTIFVIDGKGDTPNSVEYDDNDLVVTKDGTMILGSTPATIPTLHKLVVANSITIKSGDMTKGNALTVNPSGLYADWQKMTLPAGSVGLYTGRDKNPNKPTTYINTLTYVDLEPGRYAVNVTICYYMATYDPSLGYVAQVIPAGYSYRLNLSFTDEDPNRAIGAWTDTPVAQSDMSQYLNTTSNYIGRYISEFSRYGMVQGTLFIDYKPVPFQNVKRRFYLMAGQVSVLNPPNSTTNPYAGWYAMYIGSNAYGENAITYYKLNSYYN